MGCDIHAMIERRTELAPGWVRWKNAGEPSLGRNYEVFAALAGVRDRDGVPPISEPRGLPGVTGVYDDDSGFMGDFDEHPCYEFEAYYLGSWRHDAAHSESWVTLAEVKAYDAKRVIADTSIICERDETGRVLMTARGTSRPGPHELVGERRIFTWPGHDKDRPTDWAVLIDDMERVKRDGDTDDDIRLVFFFDN